jgi:hypothetical protein
MTDVKHTLRGREDCSLNFFSEPSVYVGGPGEFLTIRSVIFEMISSFSFT